MGVRLRGQASGSLPSKGSAGQRCGSPWTVGQQWENGEASFSSRLHLTPRSRCPCRTQRVESRRRHLAASGPWAPGALPRPRARGAQCGAAHLGPLWLAADLWAVQGWTWRQALPETGGVSLRERGGAVASLSVCLSLTLTMD